MPVVEIAEFSIVPGQEDEFARLALDFAPVFRELEGCTSYELQRSVDVEGRFLLLIGWETIEDHTEKAPTAEGFQRFVAAVEPTFAAAPRVFHTTVVEAG